MGRVQVCDWLGAETCLAVGEVQTADEACRRAFAQIFSLFHAGDEAHYRVQFGNRQMAEGSLIATLISTELRCSSGISSQNEAKSRKTPPIPPGARLPVCCSQSGSCHSARWCGSVRRACRNTAQAATTASRVLGISVGAAVLGGHAGTQCRQCWGSTADDENTRYSTT